MSKPTQEQRRELVQTLLIVGGIVGGLVSVQPSYSSWTTGPLVVFVIIASAFYAVMFIEKFPMIYPLAAFGVSMSFAYLLASIDYAVSNSKSWATFTFVLLLVTVFLGLIMDWDKYNASKRPTTPNGTAS